MQRVRSCDHLEQDAYHIASSDPGLRFAAYDYCAFHFAAYGIVRVDEKRLALIYDCFEYKGKAFTVAGPLPTNRSILRFQNAMHLREPRRASYGFGGYGSSEDDDSRVRGGGFCSSCWRTASRTSSSD